MSTVAAAPIMPEMPTPEDEARSKLVRARECILNDDHGEVAREYLKAKTGEEKAAILGAPDTSVNPLASICRQLSTPGLYGTMPGVRHRDADSADVLINETSGQLAQAGWLTKMPRVQYLAVGLGEYLVRLDVPAGVGHLTARPVSPCEVYVEWDPDQPDVPVALWERRLRFHVPRDAWVYAWDQYDIREGREAYRVVAWLDGKLEDMSSMVLKRPDGTAAPAGGFVVEAYPYRDPRGRAFLPWVVYRAVDSGRMWNHSDKRGLTVGTLNATCFATYAGHAALSASGRSIIAVGIAPIGANVQQAPTDTKPTNRVRTRTIMPGSIEFTEATGTGPVLLQEIGPGAELGVLQAFNHDYELNQAVRAGLNPSDATRTAANPTSGSALAISDKGRREYADQVRPLFFRKDLEVLRKSSWLVRLAGIGSPPEDGYTIEYRAIPLSIEEQQAAREAFDWAVSKGYESPLEGYRRLHPGTSDEAATSAIVTARLDQMRLDQAVEEAAIAAGLKPKPLAAKPFTEAVVENDAPPPPGG